MVGDVAKSSEKALVKRFCEKTVMPRVMLPPLNAEISINTKVIPMLRFSDF